MGAVLCLQEDSDMAWFGLDVAPIEARCRGRGDIQHIRHARARWRAAGWPGREAASGTAGRRFRIRDFDPFDVRIKLPQAVQIVADQVAAGRKVYIHCTAGATLPHSVSPQRLRVAVRPAHPILASSHAKATG